MKPKENNLTMQTLELKDLKGVGPKLLEKLLAIKVQNINDLVLHFPRRYIDKTKVRNIVDAKLDEEVVICGKITSVTSTRARSPSLMVEIEDATGTMLLRWFKFYPHQENKFTQGKTVVCFGKVQRYAKSVYIPHPECKVLSATGENAYLEKFLTPIYASTAGLHQKTIAKLVQQSLDVIKFEEKKDIDDCIKDYFPYTFLESASCLHKPLPEQDLVTYRKRLAFEEMLAHHLSHRAVKQIAIDKQGVAIKKNNDIYKKLIDSLPFSLTNAQKTVTEEIFSDMNRTVPMMRLVQGDVGSGKTIVAMLAALMVSSDKQGQVVLMAPTEILAGQHYKNFLSWCEQFNIRVGLYTGKLTSKEQNSIREEISMGVYDIVIGTHALFQDKVIFNNLALVIIDEQHRFGVSQRESLLQKGRFNDKFPHLLVMTATPIPRTLALIFYADLDCSVIDEIPPTRKPVTTLVLSNKKRDDVLNKVRDVCSQGQQVYWVCPFIEESEVLDGEAAEKTVEDLKQKLAPLKVGLLHGRMSTIEKQEIMDKFLSKDIHVLCATTVIEVGVDVPNASLMVIENPERMGLSQLHQLRGRVGRGANLSYCILLYQSPLSQTARTRLEIMRETSDGFVIAEHDLKLRGPGEIFGMKQTGAPNFKVADLVNDVDLLPKIRDLSAKIMMRKKGIAKEIVRRWLVNCEATNIL